ncbi:hypothetical protein [Ruminococcus sp. 5_1_39BFAA]|uniref:hypothetical protein n=1 Tax=Ruminococcus sp. 5_1_39BFAA TaxID=457412 RepID=UPI0035614459
MMRFEKLAELADDITMSDENKRQILQNCKKRYEERKKRRLLTTILMGMVKTR